jgi:diguanylate cyclase (GGDEF)-like protein
MRVAGTPSRRARSIHVASCHERLLIVAPTTFVEPGLLDEELRGFVRTVAEIEWLLLILVLLYQVVLGRDEEGSAAVLMALFFYAAFILSFHYAHFYRQLTRWHLAIETWVMIAFITWVLVYTGRLESPLANLYLLVIITSALTLGKLITLLEVGLIAACYVFLGFTNPAREMLSIAYASTLGTQLAPSLLVAYITTMLSADTRSALSRIKLLSETDEMTGIFNRRALLAILERMLNLSNRYGHPLSILTIDADSLKDINDSMGHEAGNRLLKLTVKAIQEQLRDTDVLARYGGDEFVVLLPETPCKDGLEVAERIRHAAETTITNRHQSLTTTVSIGVACFPDHGKELEALLEKSDQAMYLSKNKGKNRVTVYYSS